MKRIISCFLSCILLLQMSAHSQTIRPTKQKVADIYNKIYTKANSTPTLKDFKYEDDITPLFALSAIAAGVKINTKSDMAYWLKQFNIPISADASILDIYDEVYSQLVIDRFANNVITESVDNTYYESAMLLNQINMQDPAVVENCMEYLDIIKDLNIAEESQKIGIEYTNKYTNVDLEIAKRSFAESCSRIKVNPVTVINAYGNYSQLPDMLQLLTEDEKLLRDFTRELSVLKGRYLALNELMTIDEGEIERTVKKYQEDYKITQKNYAKQLKNLGKYFKKIENADNTFVMKIFKQRQDFVEDINLKRLENEGKLITADAFYNGTIVPTFTKTGIFALSFLALFDIAQRFVKEKNIKSYSSARNHNEMALQDAIDDNKNHLFAFLEQLPDKERNTAFAYIAENYYDNFKNQTENLLFALAVLEGPSLNNVSVDHQKVQQTASDKFDKIYPNVEQNFKQNVFN